MHPIGWQLFAPVSTRREKRINDDRPVGLITSCVILSFTETKGTKLDLKYKPKGL